MAKRGKDFPVPPCFEAPGTETQRLVDLFVEIVQAKRLRQGQCPAERVVFRKLHGVAHGRFEVLPTVKKEWRVGLFAHDRLDAWVRFSSDASPTDNDLGSTLGIGIKLFGVPGEKALGGDGDTADLIMQNFPIFFLDNAREMVEFTYAGVVLKDYDTYNAEHPHTARISNEMAAKVEGSVLTTTYWAILPFRLGGDIVKYRLEPETPPQNVPDDAPDYLETDMANRLAAGDYAFTLSVQRRTNEKTMPLDRATVEWPEKESPWVPVARLVLPRQDVCAKGQSDYGQGLSYNIWRVPPENAPVPESSIAAARKAVYAAGAEMRHTANGQPLEDPSEPRPTARPEPRQDDCIVKAVIYPATGIARVGSAPEEYVIGPEVIDPKPLPPGSYRDAEGRLKREAARFRIYGVNAQGEIVRELTGPGSKAKIEWEVELANTKSAWYGFELALDIPESNSAPPTTLRNPAIDDRAALSITPGPRTVRGRKSRPARFDTGTFMGKKVYLGEIRTDADGRLIVLGGRGVSASWDGTHAITFANNEGWHDDVSDGPVNARVVLDGIPLEVIPAWVVVCPPNYAPQRKSVRTLWDLMRDVAIKAGSLTAPERPSFTKEILPIFERMAGLQWVNAGFAAGFGWKGAFDLTSPEVLRKLSDNGPAYRQLRTTISMSFRRADEDGGLSQRSWPWLYGDAMATPPVNSPRQNSQLSDTQLAMLDCWAAGNFEADWDPERVPVRTLEEVPLKEQGDMLTRASLEFCLADAFHPGCEMTWAVRSWSMYYEPFRFLHAREDWRPPTLGTIITYGGIHIPNGPLNAQTPGGITRWMAVPWQTDTASCKGGYQKDYDPYVPTFWPARVPNQVLSKSNYEIVMDPHRPMSERKAAFANRADWRAPLGTDSYTTQINNMVHGFDHLGVVEVREGPRDTDEFPRSIEVEDELRPVTASGTDDAAQNLARIDQRPLGGSPSLSGVGVHRHAGRTAEDVDLSDIEKVRRFPGGLRH